MANSRQVLQRIKTAQNISKITKAMEMVSASKMRKAQAQALASRPYAQALADALATLAQVSNPQLHPLLQEHNQGIDVLICISTDRGLSGSLNPNLFKQLISWVKKHPNGEVIMIGKKGIAFARFAGIPLHAQFTDIPDAISNVDTLPITALAKNGFISKEFSTVSVLYMDFINTLSQKPRIKQLLPIKQLDDTSDETLSPTVAETEYVFEPSAKEILGNLLPYYIENSVYQSFLESKASEHSARMVAMKNASENAKDLVSELRLVFNKNRQASITSELLDITTATLSLKS